MTLIPYAVTALVGLLNAIHSGTNAELNRSLGQPLWASMLVILVSGAVIAVAIAIVRERVPALGSFTATPWWAWLGTAIAAGPVVATVLFAGPLGAATYNGIVVSATLISALVLDNFGWVGFAVHRASPLRLLGGALMVGGITLISVF